MLVIMSGDSAAYFVGRRFGKVKLAPEISPGKTVEGASPTLSEAVLLGLISAAYLFSMSRDRSFGPVGGAGYFGSGR